MRYCQTLMLAAGAVVLLGCGADTLTAPRRPPSRAAKDCSTQIYSDPENCSDFGSGGYSYSDFVSRFPGETLISPRVSPALS